MHSTQVLSPATFEKARPFLDRALLALAVLLPVLAIGVGLAFWDGAASRFLTLYVAPMALAVPLWLRERLRVVMMVPPLCRILDVAVVSVALARFIGAIVPLSGHMLFLTYSGLTTPPRWYRTLALALIAETTLFKLGIWNDVQTWGLGAMAGAVGGAAYLWLARPGSTT